MSLVELFKDWVAEQPQHTIDHHSYDTCALGEFANHYNHNKHINHEADVIDGYVVVQSLHNVYGRNPYLIIGNGGRNPNGDDVPMDTYGELSAWLNSLEPVVESV